MNIPFLYKSCAYIYDTSVNSIISIWVSSHTSITGCTACMNNTKHFAISNSKTPLSLIKIEDVCTNCDKIKRKHDITNMTKTLLVMSDDLEMNENYEHLIGTAFSYQMYNVVIHEIDGSSAIELEKALILMKEDPQKLKEKYGPFSNDEIIEYIVLRGIINTACLVMQGYSFVEKYRATTEIFTEFTNSAFDGSTSPEATVLLLDKFINVLKDYLEDSMGFTFSKMPVDNEVFSI